MTNSEAASLTLPPELDIKAAAPLAADLIALRGRNLTLDASQVDRVGGQCLQVLLSAAGAWSADGAELSVAEPSPAFLDAIQVAGLDMNHFSARNL